MSMDSYEKDLAKTQELFAFLQGTVPEGTIIAPGHVPNLTPDQAWTVVWFLGNQYWQVTDRIDRCEVCGDLYNSACGGETLDFGNAPYSFCETCREGDVAKKKAPHWTRP